MRGVAALLALSALPAGQEAREERGRYRLSVQGAEAGREEYRLERFDDGRVVLFSKVRFEIEIAGRKSGWVADAALTMDRDFAPQLYAGYHKAGPDEKLLKIEWARGRAVSDKGRAVATSAPFLLDANVVSQLLPILRRRDPARPRVRVFRPQAMADAELSIEDRGEARLSDGRREVRARELRIVVGGLETLAHVDAEGRLLLARQAQTELLAELEGFEGLRPLPPLPEGVVEEAIEVRSGDVRLAGTLLRPRAPGKVPGALLIGGTGPQDRDGNVVKGKDGLERFAWEGPDAHLYREIARALAAAGLAVLRMDDRGCGASGGDFASAGYAQLVADARAALDLLRARPDVDGATLIGHGEGGLIAAELSGEGTLVLLAAPALTLDALLLAKADEQLRRQGTKEELIAEILAKERAVYARIREAPEDHLVIDERRTFIGWMKERFRVDPVGRLKGSKASRTVIFHGRRDEVVPVEHADLLVHARSGVEIHKLEGLDHVFRRAGGGVDAVFLRALAESVAPGK